MSLDVLELTRRLVEIPSPSGEEEAVTLFLADYLSRVGFEVELQRVTERRPNLIARRGDPLVVLSTHLDTVPPHVALSEDEAYIYGRGSCDAKGIAAAMVKAAERVVSDGGTDIGLLFVVGEEAGSPGARAANTLPNRSQFLINGEPTESRLALGMKGALRLVLRTTGRAAHSAYPHLGESAVDKLLDVLADLRRLDLPDDDVLGPTTMNIGLIDGGVAANVIAPAAQAILLFRVVDRADRLQQTVEAAVAGRATIECEFASDPVFTEKVEGFDTIVVAFTADISILTNWGRPLLFGPGSIEVAHTPHERIAKRELLGAVDAYANLAVSLAARASV